MDLVNEPPLTPDLVDRLRDHLGVPPPAAVPLPEGPPIPAPPSLSVKARARRLAGRGARRAARPLLDRLVAHIEPLVAARTAAARSSEVAELRSQVALVDSQLQAALGAVTTARAAVDLAGLIADGRPLAQQIEAATVNLQLLTDEVRTGTELLEELGFAIAPGAGIVAVPERLVELRERLEAIDRRVRVLGDQRDDLTTAPGPDAAPATHLDVPRGGSGFDYLGFELRFRGEPAAVTAATLERYLPILRDRGPVLDVGCGDGAFVAALGRAGLEASGVDLDAAMATEARAAGLDVVHGDVLDHLRALPPSSLGAVTALQVVEHLELPVLVELLELVRSRLRPGGVLIAETPNPTSLIVLGNSFILDPTHVWPLHPSLLTFLCERAGFADIRLRFDSPAEGYHLGAPPEDGGGDQELRRTVADAFAKLNHVLFGPQDYAAIATTSAATSAGDDPLADPEA